MKQKEIAITAYRCKKCGKLHYPFHDRCMDCKSRDFDAVKPQGNVRLVTYTQIFNLPWGFDQRFLIIGIGEFENGVKAMGQIKADGIENLRTGMMMKPTWEPVRLQYGEKVFGLKLEPMF